MINLIKKISIIIILLVITVSFLCVESRADFNELKDNFTNASSNSEGITKIKTISGAAITIAQVIGVGVAFIMLMVLAIKYMTSAPSDRAEIKKHLVVYIVGAVVMFSSVGILQIIKSLATVVN